MANALLPLAEVDPQVLRWATNVRGTAFWHDADQIVEQTGFLLGPLKHPTTPLIEICLGGIKSYQLSKPAGMQSHFTTNPRGSGRFSSVSGHLSQARPALESLTQLRDRARNDRQREQERTWLSENRHKHSGKWIALIGDRLLAVGLSSKEVFAKVSAYTPTPLVIKIEEADAAFAGW